MPNRTICYVPPRPLRDADDVVKSSMLLVEERLSETTPVLSGDNKNGKDPSKHEFSNPVVPATRPPTQSEINGDDEEEDTFESLDRVAPLLQIPSESPQSFAVENFSYTEITVQDDDDVVEDHDENRSEGSGGSSSSDDAFIEVNHDDASVVSNLTLETALQTVKSSRKKKKKKKEPKKKKKKSALILAETIVEGDEGSRSETSDHTEKTGKTQSTKKSSRSQRGRALKSGVVDDDQTAKSNDSLEEIIEVSTKRLPALTTLDTVSTQPTSARTTDAVAGGFRGLNLSRDSQRAHEADTASEMAPPIPKKSHHSVELIPFDESTVVSKVENKKRTTNESDTFQRNTDIDQVKQSTDDASVKSTSPKDSVAKQKRDSSRGGRRQTISTPLLDNEASRPSFPNPTVELSDMGKTTDTSTNKEQATPAKPASTSSVKVSLKPPTLVNSSFTKPAPLKIQKPTSIPEKPLSTPVLKVDLDKSIKPASTSRLQDAPSEAIKTPNVKSRTRDGRQSHMVPPIPPKPTQNQKTILPKEPPGNLSKIPPSSSQPVKKRGDTVARMPISSIHSEGVTSSGPASSQRGSFIDTTPGAYHVQGNKMKLATAHNDDRDDFSITDTSVASKKRKSKLRQQTPQSPAPSKNLVVAAELSDDVEAKIEEEVRRRIMASAVQADLVSVESESSVNSPSSVPFNDVPTTAPELKDLHKPKGVKERLFGDARQMVDIAASPESIRKRDYLQWIVKRNPATNQWIASVTTNQKAMEEGDNIEMEMSKVSYAAQSQQEAYETGLSNATPLMQRFDDNPICHCCKSKFAMFRRPVNCRNCGVCICSSCTASWPSKMLPDTYLKKNEKSIVTGKTRCR
jgi:hypothetical protein